MGNYVRWGWLALAALLALGAAWETRYQPQRCSGEGCIVLDRWTHRIGYRWSAAQYQEVRDEYGEPAARWAQARLLGKSTTERPPQSPHPPQPPTKPLPPCPASYDTSGGWGEFAKYLGCTTTPADTGAAASR